MRDVVVVRMYIYVDVAGFKGLIKERKSCGVMILVIVKVFYFVFCIRDEFSLPIYININLLIQFHSFLPILNLCPSQRKRKKISVGNPLDPA